jgi:carbon storage regulator
MLVLTRKLGESIAIDDHIKIVVVQIKGKQVRLGIKAPKETKIHREEVYQAIQDQNTEASQADMSAISSLADELKK